MAGMNRVILLDFLPYIWYYIKVHISFKNKYTQMKKLVARFKAFFASPKKDIAVIASQLDMLKGEMERIKVMPNKVEAIIELFRVISPLQDKGGFSQTIFKLQEKNYGQIDAAIKALEVLQKHITKAGRDTYGLNRTEPGEEVRAANVFLGDVFGVWTMPASYWLEHKSRFEKEDSGATPSATCKTEYVSVWYCINDYQAGSFVRSHVTGILEQIGILQRSFA